MATALVAHPVVGVNKRYRPAPAKTFQCRGYGDCRMVFSRSEHLARHIRKHTGERPFTCHCSKQFSRLDNLRQHAQTVHADKQDQNERMMRELTSLHASMAAANKAGQPRGKRNQTVNQAPVAAATAASSSSSSSATQRDPIKEEDFVPSLHYRPGTSTGYEGTDTLTYTDSWSMDAGRASSHPRPPNNYSFRDSSQSFRVPPASSSPFFNHQQQSFLPISSSSSTFSFTLPSSRDASRPPTAGATSTTTTTAEPSSSSRSLPPLAAVVSASIPHPSPHHSPPSTLPSFSSTTTTTTTPTHHVLPLPSTAFARRPHTAGRPGTAPASFFVPSKPAYAGGPGLVHQQPELPLPNYGRSAELAAAAAAAAAAGSYHHNQNQLLPLGATASYEAEPSSPTATTYNDSPFSFHPPPPQLSESTASNLRKRPFSGLDSDDSPPPSRREHLPVLPGSSASSGGSGGPASTEYDYGSESRPQSRRLTVMELCNDADVHVDGGVRPFLPSSGNGGTGNAIGGGGASRPNTSSGLCSSASALALVDGSPSPSSTVIGPASSPTSIPPSKTATAASSIRAGTQTTAVATVASSATSTTTTSGQETFGFGGFSPGGGSGLGPSEAGGGGRVSASVRSEFSPSPSPRGATGLFPATSTAPTTSPAAAATPSPPPAWSPSPLSRRGDPEYQYGFKPQFREYGSAQQSYHHLQRFGGGQEQSQREREQHRERERETRGSPTVANAYPSAAVGMKA
ncbi:hypothetical protein PISMIDRAFT_677287 [Pisolithus microcarpus 441]|uniref:C2H2-type domain-containing protein n=1 Tax=Pisolithus microcarpus 441 TaxID=765257 RepID=A0A0C9ZH06_9AGAM|nr:hypothetical protein BKA83DRAFT_677287 [Pisolithus microcarpus]KIK25289.1 hypothetical protein PISMIDRAFT_677287 [Pisolithus microcarpus 441]